MDPHIGGVFLLMPNIARILLKLIPSTSKCPHPVKAHGFPIFPALRAGSAGGKSPTRCANPSTGGVFKSWLTGKS